MNQNWISLSSIQLGGAICLPMILIGHELCQKFGLGAALAAVILGNALLTILAVIASKMAHESKKTTAENAENYFGKNGKKFFALIIAITLTSWFAIQTQVMGQDLANLVNIDRVYLNVGLACLMVGCAFFGLKGVSLLANVTLPLMILTLVLSVINAQSTSQKIMGNISGFSAPAIALVLASAIAAVVDLPTFFRHAKTKKDGIIASIVVFCIGIPLVELVGVFFGYYATSTSLTEALITVDLPLFRIWVSLFILFAGWTTNNTNLYSAIMSLRSAAPQLSEKWACVVMGGICILLSLCPLLERLMLVLDLMGVFIASMGGVVLTAYSLKRFLGLDLNAQKIAWVIGTLAGLLNIFLGGLLTPIAIVDTLIASALSLIILRIKEARYVTNYS